MNYKHCCVVDANGNYKTFVLVKMEMDPMTSQITEAVQYYALEEGDHLIGTPPPTIRPHAGAAGMIHPRWDGEAWTEAATQKEITRWEKENPDPNAKTLEELRAAKLAELSTACNAAITAGCDVVLPSGRSGHIALTAEDQINLSTAMTAVEQGAEGYPYHLDGELCAIFSAPDIAAMAQAATGHKLYHTTYYNHLSAWVRRVEAAELAKITYGAELPEDLAGNMTAILAAAQGGGTDV